MDNVERGKQLAALRRGVNLTQRNVGDHFGLTASAVSEWERGHGVPEWHRIRPLDELLKADGKVLELYEIAPASRSEAERLSALEARSQAQDEAISALSAELKTLFDLLRQGAREQRRSSPTRRSSSPE